MTDLHHTTMERMTPHAIRGDIEKCADVVMTTMKSLPESPFHIGLNLDFTNDPHSIAEHFDAFIRKERGRIDVRAVYTEMNGFYINTNRWYCDLFAYNRYGGHDDYDWLADWDSEKFDSYILAGLEPLQAVYASEAYYDFSDARYICDLLVIVKFQSLMRDAHSNMLERDVPLLVTAHDYDVIAEFPAR